MSEGVLQTLRSRQGLTLEFGRSPQWSVQALPPAPDSSGIHWILPNRLALGPLPEPAYASLFTSANIEVVLSLCAKAEGQLPKNIADKFHCYRYILPDHHYLLPLQVEHLEASTNLLHRYLRRQRSVFVHSCRGIERSPLICAAYLCRYHQLEIWEALRYVKQVHAIAAPTKSQINVLQSFVNQNSTFSNTSLP